MRDDVREDVVVVDCDLIGFKAAAASEARSIEVIDSGGKNLGEYPNRTAFKKVMTSGSTLEDYEIKDIQRPDPIANTLHTVKVMLDGIREKALVSKVHCVVQGSVSEGYAPNFRDSLLLPSKYKGNRSDTIKPLMLGECKRYIVQKYDAEMASGQETDDVCAAYAYRGVQEKKYVVQASTDKDANSNLGYLLNWDKMDKPELISGLGGLYMGGSKGDEVKGKGRKWFYHQILFGDRADNYVPYSCAKARFGEKASFKVLNDLTTDAECWQAIYDTYKKWYPETFEYTSWDGQTVVGDAIQQMQLYIDCAHMRRWEGDRVMAYDTLVKMGVVDNG